MSVTSLGSPPDARAPTPLWSRGAAVALALLVLAMVYLRWQGRGWWCACGRSFPVSWVVQSQHNSQHLLDAYSLSHVLHGVLFFGLLWLFRRQLTLGARAAIAAAIEIGWEVLENSPIVIERYRKATVSLGYTGDSIVNSVGDVASFVLGFYLARKLRLWRSVAIFVVVELLMLWMIRDNLVLNVLMLLWPLDAVRRWQSGS